MNDDQKLSLTLGQLAKLVQEATGEEIDEAGFLDTVKGWFGGGKKQQAAQPAAAAPAAAAPAPATPAPAQPAPMATAPAAQPGQATPEEVKEQGFLKKALNEFVSKAMEVKSVSWLIKIFTAIINAEDALDAIQSIKELKKQADAEDAAKQKQAAAQGEAPEGQEQPEQQQAAASLTEDDESPSGSWEPTDEEVAQHVFDNYETYAGVPKSVVYDYVSTGSKESQEEMAQAFQNLADLFYEWGIDKDRHLSIFSCLDKLFMENPPDGVDEDVGKQLVSKGAAAVGMAKAAANNFKSWLDSDDAGNSSIAKQSIRGAGQTAKFSSLISQHLKQISWLRNKVEEYAKIYRADSVPGSQAREMIAKMDAFIQQAQAALKQTNDELKANNYDRKAQGQAADAKKDNDEKKPADGEKKPEDGEGDKKPEGDEKKPEGDKKVDENMKLRLTIAQIRQLVQEAGDMGVSPDDVRELVLYITNDSDLYHRWVEPIIANLRRKVKKGIYDPELAVKLWKVLADEGAKKYDKELNDGPGRVDWINVPTRIEIAKELRDHYQERVDDIEDIAEGLTVTESDVHFYEVWYGSQPGEDYEEPQDAFEFPSREEAFKQIAMDVSTTGMYPEDIKEDGESIIEDFNEWCDTTEVTEAFGFLKKAIKGVGALGKSLGQNVANMAKNVATTTAGAAKELTKKKTWSRSTWDLSDYAMKLARDIAELERDLKDLNWNPKKNPGLAKVIKDLEVSANEIHKQGEQGKATDLDKVGHQVGKFGVAMGAGVLMGLFLNAIMKPLRAFMSPRWYAALIAVVTVLLRALLRNIDKLDLKEDEKAAAMEALKKGESITPPDALNAGGGATPPSLPGSTPEAPAAPAPAAAEPAAAPPATPETPATPAAPAPAAPAPETPTQPAPAPAAPAATPTAAPAGQPTAQDAEFARRSAAAKKGAQTRAANKAAQQALFQKRSDAAKRGAQTRAANKLAAQQAAQGRRVQPNRYDRRGKGGRFIPKNRTADGRFTSIKESQKFTLTIGQLRNLIEEASNG